MQRVASLVVPVALAVLCFGVTSCGGSVATAPTADISGVYTLRTVNGHAPPAVISQNSQRTVEVLAATLTISADHSYALSDQLRITAGTTAAPQADASSGSWVADLSRVTFTPSQPGLLSVTTLDYDKGTLTLVDTGGSVPVTMVFTR